MSQRVPEVALFKIGTHGANEGKHQRKSSLAGSGIS